MALRQVIFIVIAFFIIGCSTKQPVRSSSHTVIFKTPAMKFYDKGFITKYDDHINLTVYNIGQLVLYLDIYKDKVCQSTFKCMEAKEFNLTYLHNSYKDDFLYNLFSKNKIYHKDKKNNILIKVK
jgi:hypothetical protein